MKASNITLIIFTKNEEARLPRLLKKMSSQIPTIVFDGGSSDNTKMISTEYGAKFVERPESNAYGLTPSDLAFGLDYIETEYVLFANCSHIYSDELISKFIETAKIGYYKAVYTGSVNFRFGSEVQRSNTKKNCQSCVMYSRAVVDKNQSYIHNETAINCPEHLKLTLEPVDKYLISIVTSGSFDQLLIKNSKYAKREVDELKILHQSKRHLSKKLIKTLYIMWSMRPKNVLTSAYFATIFLNICYDLTVYFCSQMPSVPEDKRLSGY